MRIGEYEVVRGTVDGTTWYFHSSNVGILQGIAEAYGVEFDLLEACPLRQDNGVLKVWKIGEWVEKYPQYTEEDRRVNAGSTKKPR